MKREIKYRQPIRNKKGEFVEWFYWDIFISPAIQQNGLDTRSESQQFTGLTDKNGKEIYEGDIVELKTNYHTQDRRFGWQKVEIFFENLQYLCKNNLGQIYDLIEETDKGSYCWEVVGNIYENPELL